MLWRDAISEDINNMQISLEVFNEGYEAPVVYKHLNKFPFYSVNMFFTQNDQFVANGLKCVDPEGGNYAVVVSGESVRMALVYELLFGWGGYRCIHS